MSELIDISLLPIAELAWYGDAAALRVLEGRVRKDVRKQERYAECLLGSLFPGRDFETTTAPVILRGNRVRDVYTTDVFTIATASHEQRVAAALYALNIKRNEP